MVYLMAYLDDVDYQCISCHQSVVQIVIISGTLLGANVPSLVQLLIYQDKRKRLGDGR